MFPTLNMSHISPPLMTTTAFCVIVLWGSVRLWGDSSEMREENRFLESVFLTLAWFWFLSPTQNPWYWTWALPLVPFARSRSWLLVSGLAMLYYLRFWFQADSLGGPQLGSVYAGVGSFDHVVVWLEHGPFLLILLAEWWTRGRRKNAPTVSSIETAG